jgi:Na+/H+ antiporter NhaD/arsenite permease-like protein
VSHDNNGSRHISDRLPRHAPRPSPRLQLDRTGVALLGAIALLATGAIGFEEANAAVDKTTLALLFGLMVVSAQLRLGGFYARVTEWLATLGVGPSLLLAILIFTIGALSAVFSNDIVCLAVTPVLIDACRRRNLDPVPFLLGLAAAANVGSAATLIGNPQNMLIGQTLGLSFAAYLVDAVPPVLFGLLATWGVIAFQHRGRWTLNTADDPAPEDLQPFDRWQTTKGIGVALFLLVAFLFTSWPREIVALTGAGILLMSRRLHSRSMLGLVDWQLLVLFIGLFVVNHALEAAGFVANAVSALETRGIHPDQPGWLFVLTLLLSNTVSNVPAVMLLLPVAHHPQAGPLLGLVSTLAGNFLIVGSIANIIVVDMASQKGIAIDWRRHARTGIPVTLVTLALAAVFLWMRG